MKQYVLIVFLSFVLLGCQNNSRTQKIEQEGEPAVSYVKSDDEEMNLAIKTAKQTIGKFDAALKSKNDRFNNFFLKVCFNENEHKEHIWIGDIAIKDNEYFGVVNNLPVYITTISLDDTIQINKDDISDWMYIDNERLIGGFTMRVLRNRVSDAEKEQFDAETGLIFDE
jgi:uncharacterized protein YegJ (DUF2314 family)